MSSVTENQQAFAKTMLAKHPHTKPIPVYQNRFYRLYFTRRFCEWLFSAVLIFSGQEFLLQNGLYSAVWPAAGVGLSALFLRGNVMLLGIFTGLFASYLFNHFPFTVSISNSILFTLNLYLIRYCCLRFFGSIAPLHTSRVCLQLISVVVVFCALHTGWQYLFYPDLPWLMAFFGELNGILCLTPLCLVLEPFTVKRLFMKGSFPAWLFGGLLVIGHSSLFFIPQAFAVIWAAILLIGLCVYAYQFRGAATGMLLLGTSVVYLTATLEPFHLFQYAFSLNSIITILTLFSVGTIISLLLACRCTRVDFLPSP
ncbi:hypothetical protein [Candidatus Berkiella aquae]|uniref:MASE1 domain-containing protein n=2 Tax=Candidatus Berkiella aquae TaxID=295108 RepID=A0AAE3L8F0_9GAMM|nr:hypothetical protein [Candidatus Berkiella aquae]MCS5710865.1 hypothetical protein [Candidatus Berkiella aquae]